MHIVNYGVAGDSTALMLARASDADKYKPFRVIVWGGIVDVAAGASAASIESNLQAIYTHFNYAEVFALTITPRDDNTAGMVAIRDAVNTWIKTTATGLTRVIDTCTLIADPANLTARLAAYADPASPNHINDAGIALIVNTIVNG